MQITWNNYRSALPENLWNAFVQLANSSRAQYNPIIYKDKTLRFANIDEL